MPIASLRKTNGRVVVAKGADSQYDDTPLPKAKGVADKESATSVKAFECFVSLARNCAEKEWMKLLMVSTHNLSARHGAMFGIWNMRCRAERINPMTNRINKIKSKHAYFAML